MAIARSRGLHAALLTAAVAGGLATAGCMPALGTAAPIHVPPKARTAPMGTLSTPAALEALEQIPGTLPTDFPKYDPNAFGNPLASVDRNGCGIRFDVLLRDAGNSGGMLYNGCTIKSITMTEPYAGRTVHNATELDIDYVVPLSAAWRAGAYAWTPAQRLAFARDQRNMLAVDKRTGEAARVIKNAGGLWLPATAQCDYARMYVSVLDANHLSADAVTVKDVLGTILKDCG
jgi:hypothetical protein